MMIVITPETDYPGENKWVTQLLEEALPRLHIRKYAYTDQDMQNYVEAIPTKYRERLVLHSHFHLADNLGINRLHAKETLRKAMGQPPEDHQLIWSTSTHSIAAFNSLSSSWSYAFLSPMFTSISKPGYGNDNALYSSLGERQNQEVQLIALGGMKPEHVAKTLHAGAEGIAVLGGIWTSEHPVRAYAHYRERYHAIKSTVI